MMKKRLLRFLFPENAESFLEFKPTDTPSFILSSSRNKSLGLEAPSSCRFLCILVSRWNSSFKFPCQGILYFISVDLASPRSDHMKIHVKNIVCSYWNLGNLFSDCEQFQPIFGTPLWPDHSLQCNLWWHCNIWTFHHCPAPVLRGAWTLLSALLWLQLPPPLPLEQIHQREICIWPCRPKTRRVTKFNMMKMQFE